MLRVNLIGKSNGAGLSHDLSLLAEALSCNGCEVTVTTVGSRESGQRRSLLQKMARRLLGSPKAAFFDVNVMLEHVWWQFADDAKKNVVVPNPEFFDRHDRAALSAVNRVWAKTGNTQAIFSRFDIPVSRIGFDSEDRWLAGQAKQQAFFHLAGNSPLKGTSRLLAVWQRHPHWPLLQVVGRLPAIDRLPSNIELHTEYVQDATLKIWQNRCFAHLCTSETEGWGHYLAEALSVGALTVTLDAPPMNELVTQERGLLLPCMVGGSQRLASRYVFDESALEQVVEHSMAMPGNERDALGQNARRWFLDNKSGFAGRINAALNEL